MADIKPFRALRPRDDMVERIAALPYDVYTRKEAYEKAQDLLFEEMPMLYLSLESNTWATGAKLQNVKIYPDGAINMKNAKMAN